jgi:hypothetical protein
MSQLVITKALSKAGEYLRIGKSTISHNCDIDYAGKQAHVELAGRMKQRDAGMPFEIIYLALT